MNKKGLVFLLIFPVALHLFSLFFLHFNERFSPRDFSHGFREEYITDVEGLNTEQLDPIFAQPFHYLGRGKQMVALESADGKYVIKLFNPMRPQKRQWYRRWDLWKRYSSLKWISREWFQKKARLAKLFKRHKIAFEHLQNETGLLFVHLAPSEKVIHYLHMTDEKGKNHILTLADTPFVLQKKAILVPSYLQSLIEKGEEAKAEEAIHKLENLFAKRLALGISDRIQTMHNNYGFVGDEPIQIDVGRINIEEEFLENPEKEQARLVDNLHMWVDTRFPNLDVR